MKTELVFRLEQEPMGYGETFSPNCKIDITNSRGILYLDYNNRYPVGSYENLRQNGELILADVEIFQNFKSIEHRFEYSVGGSVEKKNEKNQVEEVKIHCVSALIPTKD